MIKDTSLTILAIDTATQVASIALYHQGRYATKTIDSPKMQSEKILSCLDAVCKESNILLTDIHVIAVCKGPGSFTGLRVGISLAQALGFAHDIPIVPIDSLAILAIQAYRMYQLPRFLVANDARMQEIYWGLYTWQNGMIFKEGAISVSSPDICIQMFQRDLPLVGDAGIHYPQLSKHFEHYYPLFPLSHSLIELAYIAYEAHDFISAEALLPEYVRHHFAEKSSKID